MAATYVTKAELRTNLGIGSLYSDTTVEEVCQTAEDLLNSYLWFDSVPVVAAALASNVATLILSTPGSYAAYGTTVTAVLLPVKGTAVSATNPLYTVSILVNNLTPLNGAVGDISNSSQSFTCNSTVVQTTTGSF